MNSADNAATISFSQFYQKRYLAEHRHPANVALHVLGTVGGLMLFPWVLFTASWYWFLLFPVVHAGPGLIGHRLFERNLEVGDVRVLRKDFSPLWFIAANHLLLLRLVSGRVR